MPEGTGDVDRSYISWRSELARKGIHLCSLLIPLAYYIFNPDFIIIGLFIAFVISSAVDLLRFFGNHTVKKYLGLTIGFLLRPREQKSFSGSTTILFAALLVYLFFELRVAAAAMVIVVVGDTAAAFIGRLIGRIRLINHKSLEGTLAFVVFSLAALTAVPGLSFQIGLVGALVGAVFELLPIPIDDNITVPLVAGGAMQLLISYNLIA
jgi:dolichol kinase